MPKKTLVAFLALVCAPACYCQVGELRLDPLMLVDLKECRNIAHTLGDRLFPGWEFQKTPVLFYRPDVQELLVNFPHAPTGYSVYTGFNPLGDEPIYVRNDSTFFGIDDQNTSIDIDSIPVLVVADPYSALRNQLRDVLGRPRETAEKWLQEWYFIPSPYDRLQMVLHEAFHVYQTRMAPDKWADETAVTTYPLLDPVNNTLSVLEGGILRDASLADGPAARLEKIREFVAVRAHRQSRLDRGAVEYESMIEYSEGLAKYVEYKFMKLGGSVEPVREMYYHQGFNGYRGILPKLFESSARNMADIVAVNDDRFGNKYGSGPLRYKHYELGAFQALLLDEVMPSWKGRIIQDTVSLTGLLQQTVPLSAAVRARYLKLAKREYQYDRVYQAKLQFEQEGRRQIAQKLSGILETRQILVKILYGGFAERIGLGGFTPFGVTQITKNSAIYDLVPIKVVFRDQCALEMKQAIPVLIDRDHKLVAFAIPAWAADSRPDAQNRLEMDEFILSGSHAEITRLGNTVEIQLR